MKYNPSKIEKKWQKRWEEQKLSTAQDFSDKPKKYILIEFPYPSGAGLHVGHVRSYTALDVVARKCRMQGQNVLYPIGWDAFGLPTENYAIKNKIHPSVATAENVATFKKQIQSLGLSYDWSREINTTDPGYYKWTQWIFLQLFKNGLAYKKKMAINWCPSCKIGLANEEVVEGACERCGTPAQQREKEQWMLAITKYADRLIDDLDTVEYLEKIKTQQKNWIGRSFGATVTFNLQPTTYHLPPIQVFTTRVDTIFGCTYIVIAPESDILSNIKSQISNLDEVEKYIEQANNKTVMQRTELAKEKTGVELKGVKAINPFNGSAVPIFVADYVLGSYGTGAVMAVPAHDERDFEFAKKYDLPTQESVVKQMGERREDAQFRNTVYGIIQNEKGEVLVQYLKQRDRYILPGGGLDEGEEEQDGLLREVKEETGYVDVQILERIGSVEANYHSSFRHSYMRMIASVYCMTLRSDSQEAVQWDEFEREIGLEHMWMKPDEAIQKFKSDDIGFAVFSELFHRYMHNVRCFTEDGILVNSGEYSGLFSQEAREKMTDWLEETGNGERTVNYKLRDWVFSRQHYWGEPIPIVHCEKCGAVGIPEEELPLMLPNVVSYEPTDTGESPLANISEWVNTVCPVCGLPAKRETDTMPNWAGSSWYFLRYIDPKNESAVADPEKLKYWMPVDLYNGGMEHTTLHLLYSRFWNKFLYDIGVVPVSEPYQCRRSHGMILSYDGQKMSKSKGNVINPDDVVREFGADSIRLYEMFMGPFGEAIAWNTEGVSGVRRFLEKIWRLFEKVTSDKQQETSGNKEVEVLLHKTIKKVTEDIENFRFNTAISSLMILVNALGDANDANDHANDTNKDILSREIYKKLLLLLSPFAPHIAEELWEKMGHTTSIFLEKWPAWDSQLIVDETITMVVQVNGKVRDTLAVPSDIDEARAKELALASEKVQKFIAGKAVRKVIFVKGKLVSIVAT